MANSIFIGKYRVKINAAKCIGCGACAVNAPGVFEISEKDGMSVVKDDPEDISLEDLKKVVDMCPMGAISILDEKGDDV